MTLLTLEHQAWIGTAITFRSDVITASEARRFVAATGDGTPFYPQPEDAGSDQAGAPVPPMLYYAATRPFARTSDVLEDGTVAEHRPMIGTGQTMGGSVEIEWFRDLVVGDRLTGVRTLTALTEKTGRTRSFVVATWVTDYFDAEDTLVVRESYEQILF